MQFIYEEIKFKQILISLIAIEILLLVLSPFELYTIIIPFAPIIIYALNLKLINKEEVTLIRLRKHFVLATILFVISLCICLFCDHYLFERWSTLIGFISAISLIGLIIKCVIASDSQTVDDNYAKISLLTKEINTLYLLFSGFISIEIYHHYSSQQSLSSSTLLNSQWLICGVISLSIHLKIIFLCRKNACKTIESTPAPPSFKKLAEYTSILKNHFEEHKIYLRHDLNKEIISQETDIPISHINYLFKYYLEVDVSYFIAEYRIAYALKLIQDKGHVYTLNAISYESGFRSRVTFNKYFKIFTNVLPSEYLNKSKRYIS